MNVPVSFSRKKLIRKSLLELRQSMQSAEYQNYSEIIADKLLDTDSFKHAATVHIYQAATERHEVDTSRITKEALAMGKKVGVPVVQKDGILKHVWYTGTENMKLNQWDIPEPLSGDSASPADFELIIVPMVGADERRNRLGYGKGFYDRFLAEVTGETIGLAFECCLIPELPIEPHDIRLSKIITEKRIF